MEPLTLTKYRFMRVLIELSEAAALTSISSFGYLFKIHDLQAC